MSDSNVPLSYRGLGTETKIIGTLGHALGQIIAVTGIIVDDDYRRRRSDLGKTLLKVDVVEGVQVTDERIIELHRLGGTGLVIPEPGQSFSCIGFETGSMQGIPAKAFDYIPQVATSRYCFATYFIPLAVAQSS